MPRALAAVAVALSLVLAAGACAQDVKAITRTDLTKKLEDPGGLKPKFAECVAEQLYPQLKNDDKKNLNGAQSSTDIAKALKTKTQKAGDACRAKGVTPAA